MRTSRRTVTTRRRTTRRPRRSVSRVARRVPRSLGRLGRLSNVYHYKGTINAGIISWTSGSATATTLAQIGGVYVFRLDDLPIFENAATMYEFVRINRCRMEFMPRYNTSNLPSSVLLQFDDSLTGPSNIGSTTSSAAKLPTFITGYDEVPLVSPLEGDDLALSGTWSSEGGDDSNVAEMKAYGCQGGVTPSYIRGMIGSKETEIYKKHVVHFTPAFFDYAMTSGLPFGGTSNIPLPGSGVFERRQKKWINCNSQLQGETGGTTTLPTSSDTPSVGPDFYGPVYSFSQAGINTSTTAVLQLYDVKMYYSVSFRRVRGA